MQFLIACGKLKTCSIVPQSRTAENRFFSDASIGVFRS
jgi:hypothetical protein